MLIKRDEQGDVVEPFLIIGGIAVAAILLIQLLFGLVSASQEHKDNPKKNDKSVIQEEKDPRYRD